MVVGAVAFTACGGGDGESGATAAVSLTVPKVAGCAAGDSPEAALQGQVPASMRATGFKGFNCNLSRVGTLQGDGAAVSFAAFRDGAGRVCTYNSGGTSPFSASMTPGPGVTVVDISDASRPLKTGTLLTKAMLDPWESMRVNARRQILVANNGFKSTGGPQIDIYDLSGDCRFPQLLASADVGTGADGGVTTPGGKSNGHEGAMAPDGLTYYIGDTVNRRYHAIDITNTTQPRQIASFDTSVFAGALGAHGLSVSADGNRIYGVILALPATADVTNPDAPPVNGFAIFDTSEVQARTPGATIKLVSSAFFKDGSGAQHTIPITVKGKPYVVMVDEGGSGGIYSGATFQAACSSKLPPFAMARIFDVGDEKKPVAVSKLQLETNDPGNCDKVAPDLVGLSLFTYGSHFCSVDNRDNATALACTYFNSGIRVFDIRDPAKPKEIAYYNPPATPQPGANSAQLLFGQWTATGPDWCGAQLHFDYQRKQLVSVCMSSGLQVLQFAARTWPFAESTESAVQQ
jgi:hypothetical protein